VEAELDVLITMSRRPDGWKPPVVRTIATDGEGVGACAGAILSFREFQRRSPADFARRVHVQKERLLELVRSQVARVLERDRHSAERLQNLAVRVVERETDPFSAAEELRALVCAAEKRRRE